MSQDDTRPTHPPAALTHRGPFDLSGRVALVTGGSKGIGAAIAQSLAGARAAVIITGRDDEALARVATAISDGGGVCDVASFDVRDQDAIARARDDVFRRHGRVDIVVNNAGINVARPALEISEEDWDGVMDINLKSYFFVARAFAAAMIERRYGKIINVSSIFGEVGWPQQAAYAASKGGVALLTKTLAVEWAEHGIRVNALAPSYTEVARTMALYEGTAMYDSVIERTPMRRWSVPEDLTGPAVFLAAPASDFVTGQTLIVDGGYTSW